MLTPQFWPGRCVREQARAPEFFRFVRPSITATALPSAYRAVSIAGRARIQAVDRLAQLFDQQTLCGEHEVSIPPKGPP